METTSNKYKLVYFISIWWWGLFMGLSILISLVLLVLVFHPLGLSMASDTNFGLIALISGVISDQIFKLGFQKQVMISKMFPYSILYVWIPLCLYVIFFHPLDG